MAAFAVSAYASSYFRAGSKPFNPVLGETYECIREDKGFQYFSEQVDMILSVCWEELLMPFIKSAFEIFIFHLSQASKQLRSLQCFYTRRERDPFPSETSLATLVGIRVCAEQRRSRMY